jgi:hypothetical protein
MRTAVSSTGNRLTHEGELWEKSRVGASAAESRIMLGFVVRQCAVALGHPPTPVELAEWANNQRDARGRYRIFGRPVTVEEAGVILRHPGRLVTVRLGARWAFASAAGR